jgi:hypothetical protein
MSDPFLTNTSESEWLKTPHYYSGESIVVHTTDGARIKTIASGNEVFYDRSGPSIFAKGFGTVRVSTDLSLAQKLSPCPLEIVIELVIPKGSNVLGPRFLALVKERKKRKRASEELFMKKYFEQVRNKTATDKY